VALAADNPRRVSAAACVLGVVLRWYAPRTPAPNPDELFTGIYANGPIGGLVDRLLARGDTHPPLDYALRAPFVGGGDLLGLRLVSLVSASLTVVLVWWWMRGRGWLGTATIAFTAASPFLIYYGRMARPYSPLILATTLVAVGAERWSSESPSARRWEVVTGVALVVALLLESSAALAVLGCVVLPGLRRDRQAWEWRGMVAVAVAAWVVLWGWRIPGQYAGQGAEWIPLVTPGSAVVLAGSLVAALRTAAAVAVVPLGALGLVLLHRLDAGLARLCLRLAIVPLVAGLVAAGFFHIGVARSFASAAWAAPILLAAVLVAAARRAPVLAGIVVVCVAVLIGPSLLAAYQADDGTGRAAARVAELAQPRDFVAIRPTGLDHVLRWTFNTGLVAPPAGVDKASVVRVGGPGATGPGRLWTIEVEDWRAQVTGWRPCPGGTSEELEVIIRCYEAPEAVTPPR
jgi:hypothetical protein